MKKAAIFVVLAGVAFASYWFLDLGRWLSLSGMQSGLSSLTDRYAANPFAFSASYFVAYAAASALAIPGAALLTLVAGSIFGLVKGVIIALSAATVGATASMVLSRFFLQRWLESKFPSQLEAVNRGIERDGAFYLFTLRLVPLFPFFLINVLMGMTRIKTWTYFWVSLVGMFPGSLVYVNAGRELAQIRSLSDITSPSLWLAFAALAALPWIGKWIVHLIKSRKVYAGYTRPKNYDDNIIVLGAGAGGLVTAYIAAATKAQVSLVEAHKMGGDCLNYGCVPSKALLAASKARYIANRSQHLGVPANGSAVDFRQVMTHVNKSIETIEPHDSVDRYTNLGVNVITGYGTIVDPWTVEVRTADDRVVTRTAKNIVLATGASPRLLDVPGFKNCGYLTSESFWRRMSQREEVPPRLLVVGGGAVGCEISQAMARLGSDVTLVHRGSALLSDEDPDVTRLLLTALEDSGVQVKLAAEVVEFTGDADQRAATVAADGTELSVGFDEVLVTIGRVPRSDGFGLDTLNIDLKQSSVNGFLQTPIPNIYVVGDALGVHQFTHAASHEAWHAAVNALFGSFKKFKVNYDYLPWTIYTDPEVARVGLNQRQAKERGIPVEVTRYDFKNLDRAITEAKDTGFLEILTAPGRDKILGATVVGSHGGEIISQVTVAMKNNLGLNKILGTIHAYPGWSEATKAASGQWKNANKPERLLRWAKTYHAIRRR